MTKTGHQHVHEEVPIELLGAANDSEQQFQVHRVLGSCGFQWCSFHSCAFSKNSPNIQLMQFSLHKWRKSFTSAFLVINDLSATDLVFERPKKMHEPRTGCTLSDIISWYMYHPFFSFLDLKFAKPLCVIELQHTKKKRSQKNWKVG